MCGIVGVFKREGVVSVSDLKRMTDSILHRGPDGEGHWVNSDNRIGFGHRRLSIIDLSTNGHQPMITPDGRYTITFNGEIYNYLEIKAQLEKSGFVFKSHSDTEVLLALFSQKKEKCLDELDGMFSFSIWDEKEKKLFCARDRFGEKPFYYSCTENREFVFGSEMKELFAYGIPKNINQKMLYNFFLYRHAVDDPREPEKTFYTDINKLEPAHYLYVDSSLRITKVKYWDIDLAQVNTKISIQEASEKLRDLFYQSIRLRLRSDVPVGSSLSGGLDSSSIVCAIDRMNADNKIRQKTFSARFKQFEKDEGKYMLQVINSTKVDPYFIYPDEETFVTDFDKMCFHQEEPFASASVFAQWQVMKLAKQQGVTVLLDGQGADEVLAGYHFYMTTYLKELYGSNREKYQSELLAYRKKHNPNFAGFDEIEMLSKPEKKSSAKEVLKGFFRPVYRQFFPIPQAPVPGSVREFLNSEFVAQFSKREELPTEHQGGLREQLYVNTRVIGLHDLLRYADRNSMAFSREVRLPFLSHQLVEFLFTLPNEYKIHDGWTKYVMRKAFEDILPPEIAWRTDKIGYEPPQKKWMQNNQVRDKVNDAVQKLKAEGVVTAKNVSPRADDEWFSLVVANTLFCK